MTRQTRGLLSAQRRHVVFWLAMFAAMWVADPRSAPAQLPPAPPDHTVDRGGALHATLMAAPFDSGCTDCHGQRLGGASARSCFVCHEDYSLNGGLARPDNWSIPAFNAPGIPVHNSQQDGIWHAEDKENPFSNHCTDCHGPTLYGGIGPSCYQCHDQLWHNAGPATPPLDHDVPQKGALHKAGLDDPFGNRCTDCHGTNLDDPFSFVPSCYECHDEASGTPHDFLNRPWLDPLEKSCTPCHDWSTWNHELSSTTGYTISNSLVANDLGDPNGASARCLACHEGNVAVDSYLGRTGTEFLAGNAAFGTDLTTHHPVSFTFDTVLATAHGALNDPSTTPSGLAGGGTIAQDMLDENGRLQCTACHDPHDNSRGNFLKKTATGGLCFTCHTQTLPAGTRGKHHIPLRSDPWFRGRCTLCHGQHLDGVGGIGPACTECHDPFSFPDAPAMPEHHGGDRYRPYRACAPCHGDNLAGTDYGSIRTPACNECHGDLWASDNLPPLVDAGGPYTAATEQELVLDASATLDPEGDSLTYVWNFGDGSPETMASYSASRRHVYAPAGTYNGILRVCDGYNPPVVVPFAVEVDGAGVVGDAWAVSTTTDPPGSMTVVFDNHDGGLIVTQDDGINPTVLGIGVEMTGVIFWLEIRFDFRGSASWYVGSQYFGNINRTSGVMSGVLFSQDGQIATFGGRRL